MILTFTKEPASTIHRHLSDACIHRFR